MPFTPFHFAPGAAFKAAAPGHFSLVMFCGTQVVTDLETGYHIVTNQYPLHTFFHSFPGATIVAVACALAGKPLCQGVLRICREWSSDAINERTAGPATITWPTAFITTFVAAYSHVVLDAILHRDVRPFSPFTDANPFLQIISAQSLHVTCAVLGVAGVVVWLFRKLA